MWKVRQLQGGELVPWVILAVVLFFSCRPEPVPTCHAVICAWECKTRSCVEACNDACGYNHVLATYNDCLERSCHRSMWDVPAGDPCRDYCANLVILDGGL